MHKEIMAGKKAITQQHIQKILLRLGISMNYKGFRLCSYAIYLAVKDTDKLMAVTEKLYHATARHYGIEYGCVERNIRTAIRKAWENNPAMVRRLAGYMLTEKPTTSQFISIITFYFLDHEYC